MSASQHIDDSLMRYLLDELENCLTSSESYWAISVEHRILCLTAYIEFLSGRVDFDYRMFLRKNGLSRNGRLIVEAMRYLAIEDHAVNPTLHNQVVLGALQPLFRAFRERILPLAPIVEAPSKRVELLRKLITDHVDWMVRPNQYGNAIEIESKLLLDEQIIESVHKDVFQSLNWSYLHYLHSMNIKDCFTQKQWNKGASYFDLDSWFPEFWKRYVNQLLPLDKRSTIAEVVRQEWLLKLEGGNDVLYSGE